MSDPLETDPPRSALARLRRTLVETYLCVDPRSLGLCRIGLGILLLADLLRRAPWISVWYTNDGLLPNHVLLRNPDMGIFTLLFGLQSFREVSVFFLISGAFFLCFLLGYRTRLFHVLSVVCLLSLHNRVHFLLNAGDIAFNLLCLWTLPLPLGRRFSIDAMLASLRARRERTAADLEERAGIRGDARPVVSLAVLAMLLQLAVIMLFTGLNKTGAAWREGTAVTLVLHQGEHVTRLGVWFRGLLPPWGSSALGYWTIAVEMLVPLLLLTPVARVAARRLACLLGWSFHLGIMFFLRVGLFKATMLVYYLFLPAARDWEAVARRLRQGRRARIVRFDPGSGFQFQCARVLVRLDGLRLLRFTPLEREAGPNGGPPAGRLRLESVEPSTGRTAQGARALSEIAAALPFGPLWAWSLRLPGLNGLMDRCLDRLSRATASGWLGLEPAAADPGRGPASTRPPPAAAATRRLLSLGREALAALFIVLIATQVGRDNPVVPKALVLPRPKVIRELSYYLQLVQGWTMFAPDAPVYDRMLYVNAVTVDGRHIDPYNLVFSRSTHLPSLTVPDDLGLNQFSRKYRLRIPPKKSYHPALTDWILRHHQRTGNPADRIVSFKAYSLIDRSPTTRGEQPKTEGVITFLVYPPEAESEADTAPGL